MSSEDASTQKQKPLEEQEYPPLFF